MLRSNLSKLFDIIDANPMEFSSMRKKLTKYLLKYDMAIDDIKEHKGDIIIFWEQRSITATVTINCCSPEGTYDLRLVVYDTDIDSPKHDRYEILETTELSLKTAFKILRELSAY